MTSRAVVLKEFGQELEVTELPDAEAGSGAVVVDVTRAGMCGTDLHLQQGKLPIPTPVVLGHEAVGTVRQLGEGVTSDALGTPLRRGDHVSWASNIPCGSCYYCSQEREPSLCADRKVYGINQSCSVWPHLSGGWSERIYLQPGSTIVRVPDGVTPEEVISLGCAGPTVVHGVLDVAQPQTDDIVVVQGSGPVGIAAAMFAKIAGAAKVIIVGGPGNRLDLARQLGVGNVHIDIFTETDPGERLRRVLEHTPEGRGADIVVEATGVPAAVGEGMDMTRRNGRYVVVGQYTDHGPVMLNPHHITRKQLQVLGSWAFSPQHHIDYVRSVPKLKEQFDLSALVTAYDLERANDAVADMRSGKTLKPVLTAAK